MNNFGDEFDMPYNEFEELLNKTHEDLSDRIGRIERDIRLAKSSDADERAKVMEPIDALYAIADEAYKEIEEVEQAQQRLQNNTYGACEKCYQYIEVNRLRLHPETRYCRQCALSAAA